MIYVFYKFTERGYSDEEEEGEFSSVEEADEMTYGGGPARRRAHRQLAFNKADMSYTKVPTTWPAMIYDIHNCHGRDAKVLYGGNLVGNNSRTKSLSILNIIFQKCI